MNRIILLVLLLLSPHFVRAQSFPQLTADTIRVVGAPENDSGVTLQQSVQGAVFNYSITTFTTTIGNRTASGSFRIDPPAAKGIDNGATITYLAPASFTVVQTTQNPLTASATVFRKGAQPCDVRVSSFPCAVTEIEVENTTAGRRAFFDVELRISIVSGSTIRLRVYFKWDTSCPAAAVKAGTGIRQTSACGTVDLQLQQISAVQVIDRASTLIPGKTTLLRVFMLSGGTDAGLLEGVDGTLSSPDFPNQTLKPLNGGKAMADVVEADRDLPDHSLNFILPKEWTLKNELRINVEVSLPGQNETNLSNNRDSGLASFAGDMLGMELRVDTWGVCLTDGDKQVCPTTATYTADALATRVLPIEEDRLRYTPLDAFLEPIPWAGRVDSDFEARRLIRTLKRLGAFLRASRGIQGIYRFVPVLPMLDSPSRAMALLRASLAATFDQCTLQGMGPSCEEYLQGDLAFHLIDAFHGDSNDRPNRRLSGFDSATREIIPSTRSSDLRLGGWIDAGNYNSVLIAMRAAHRATKLESNSLRRAAPASESLIVSGTVSDDGLRGTLDPVFSVPVPHSGDSSSEGPWCLRVTRTSGAEADFCSDLDVITGNGESDFATVIPAYSDISRLSLVRNGGGAVTSLDASQPPTVSFVVPQRGEALQGKRTLSWTATDPNGKPLTYALLYTSDGGATWLPIATELTEARYDVDTDRIRGGAQVMFRVIASSGLVSASADTGALEVRQRPQLSITPQNLDFGTRAFGEVADMTLRLRNTGTGPLVLAASLPAASPFSVFPSAGQIIVAAGGEKQIIVRYQPLASGIDQASLTFTGSGTSAAVSLRGSTSGTTPQGSPVLTLSSTSIDFGTVPVGQNAERDITIRNSGTARLTINAVTSSNPRFSLTTSLPLSLDPNTQSTLRVRFTPGAASSESGALTITSNDPANPSLRIDLRGTGSTAATAIAEAEVSSLSFPNVPVRSTAEKSFRLLNRGAATLNVTSITSSNPRFSVVRPTISTFSIGSGSFENVTIQFSPLDATPQSGSLTINSNAATVTIALSGTATGGGGSTGTPATLQIDDGSSEFTVGLTTGSAAYYINRLTPQSYPATLRAVQIFFPPGEAPAGTSVTIVAGSTTSSTLTAVNLQRTTASITSIGTFVEYAVSGPTITSGDFLAGFSAAASSDFYPAAVDTSSGSKQRSYISTDGTSFRQLDSVPGVTPGNFLIRARIDGTPASTTSNRVNTVTVAGWPNQRTADNLPPAAIDGDINTFTWTTQAFNVNAPSYLGVGFSTSSAINRIRLYKDSNGGGGQNMKNLVIEYTTSDVSLPLSSRVWTPVSGLVNGFQGSELLAASAVNANGTVTNDTHNSLTSGFASLSFNRVNATGIRIGFSNPGGPTFFNHYKVHEWQVFNDVP